MACSSSPTKVLPPPGSTVSNDIGDGSKTLSLGPQVAQQIPFQVGIAF